MCILMTEGTKEFQFSYSIQEAPKQKPNSVFLLFLSCKLFPFINKVLLYLHSSVGCVDSLLELRQRITCGDESDCASYGRCQKKRQQCAMLSVSNQRSCRVQSSVNNIVFLNAGDPLLPLFSIEMHYRS